jgi:hypothetical protein
MTGDGLFEPIHFAILGLFISSIGFATFFINPTGDLLKRREQGDFVRWLLPTNWDAHEAAVDDGW